MISSHSKLKYMHGGVFTGWFACGVSRPSCFRQVIGYTAEVHCNVVGTTMLYFARGHCMVL